MYWLQCNKVFVFLVKLEKSKQNLPASVKEQQDENTKSFFLENCWRRATSFLSSIFRIIVSFHLFILKDCS